MAPRAAGSRQFSRELFGICSGSGSFYRPGTSNHAIGAGYITKRHVNPYMGQITLEAIRARIERDIARDQLATDIDRQLDHGRDQ